MTTTTSIGPRGWGGGASAAGALGLEAALATARDSVDTAGAALGRPELVGEGSLRATVTGLGDVVARALAGLVPAVVEVADRGLHRDAGFSLTDWVSIRCPGLSTQIARDVALVAAAGTNPAHARLVEAVTGGAVDLGRAARVVRALGTIRPALDTEEYESAVELLVEAAGNHRFTERELRQIITKLVVTCLSDREQTERDQAKRELRGVYNSSTGDYRRLIITLGDDADDEAIQAILTSPLAAPAKADQCESGERDERTPAQRRYDALLSVIRRGIAGSTGQPTTPKAQVMVTISLADLIGDLAASASSTGAGAGAGAGAGTTVLGGVLSAGAVRRLACEASIIPVILGSDGEILDQGRARRLVTPGQRVFLAHRDGGCTMPGCTTPATWCDAHHVIHWARGGPSDVSNYALLCPRHHTWVHAYGATATVTAFGVTWHL